MKTVGVHEAKTHLSRLIEQAVKGEPFVIAKGGTPMVKVMAIDTVLSQSWVFRAKSKNWDHKFNDLQDSKFIKNKLCDRTRWDDARLVINSTPPFPHNTSHHWPRHA